MAISVDSSVPRWTGTPANDVDLLSDPFTPADGSLLVLCVSADTTSGDQPAADITIAVSGGSLTWTIRDEHDRGTDATINVAAEGGHSSVWTAPVGTGESMTVAVQRSDGDGGTNRISCKVYIVTNQHASPIGAAAAGVINTTNDLTATLFTSTADNSYSFVAAVDWAQNGSPTSSDLTEDSADYTGAISVMSGYKDNGATGAQTGNLNAAGAGGAQWTWAAVEIKPADVGPAAICHLSTTGGWVF